MPDDYSFYHVTQEGRRGFFAGQWLRVDGPGLPKQVFIQLGSVEGRIVCTGLAIGGSVPIKSEPAEVTSHTLREVPIRRLIDAYVDASNSSDLPPLDAEFVDAMRQRALPTREIELARRGRRGYSREEHEQFANDYRAAVIKSRAPIKYLAADVWPVSERTARGRVNTLRKKGFLGPAPPGRAGEMDIPKE